MDGRLLLDRLIGSLVRAAEGTICKILCIYGNCPCLPRLILPYECMLGAIPDTLLYRRIHHVAAVGRNKRAAVGAADCLRWRFL